MILTNYNYFVTIFLFRTTVMGKVLQSVHKTEMSPEKHDFSKKKSLMNTFLAVLDRVVVDVWYDVTVKVTVTVCENV